MRKLRTLLRNRARLFPFLRATRPVFSQFGEDLAIAQLLHPQSHGTYIDVGANRPFDGSNTAYLYTLGWSGLAIDPNPTFAPEFKTYRRRDIHLTMGVAATETELVYYEFNEDWLNTFSSARAGQLSDQGSPPLRKREIPCRPLRQLIAEHLPGRHIDVLSVDCEGLDLQVLKSADMTVSVQSAEVDGFCVRSPAKGKSPQDCPA